MNNISQDKEKLLKLLQELKKEYRAGNISDDEYKYLSREYEDNLSNISAVDRIRSMQGKEVVEKPVIYSSKKAEKSKKSKEEDEKLVDKYVVKTEKEKRESRRPSGKVFVAIAIACLAVAFITGIGFGIFNFDFQLSNPTNAMVTVNESAFLDIVVNNTNNTNRTSKNNATTNSSENSNTRPNSRSNNTNTNTNTNPNRDSNTRPSSNRTNPNTNPRSR